ncbi:MAG: cytochrome bc1 complex diheme cytochrome c subunit [Acidimicrobiales bacterium]
MITTSLKRVGLLTIAGLLVAAPLTFFVSGAGAQARVVYQTTRKNAGTPNSTNVTTNSAGVVISYGNSAITYNAPSPKLASLGQALFLQNCASCHGTEANGVPAAGTSGAFPNLVGLGPATIDFWIESGRMPSADPRAVQAKRRPPRLTAKQAVAIAAWVNSLSPSYPDIPTPHLKNANVSDGAALFALNCAACHTIEGDGDALAQGTFAPSLRNIPAYQVVEAIRTGPGNMPRFTGNLSDFQVRDIVKYVTTEIQHPQNIGGLGLGGLGPVAEGFVGLLLGVGILALVGFWVGERQ